MFAAGPVENEHRGFARAKGVAFGFLHAAGGESFAVRTKGEATDAANVGDEVVQACVQDFGIEFANGFPPANGPLTNATVEIAADQVFAVRRDGEAKDTLLMALELGKRFAVGGIPDLDDGVITAADKVSAVRCEGEGANVVAVCAGDGPDRLTGSGIVPTVDYALIVSGKQAF